MGIPYLSNSRAMWGTELSTALHAALARMEALSPPAKSEYVVAARAHYTQTLTRKQRLQWPCRAH